MARRTTKGGWAIAMLAGMTLAPASHASALWKCVDAAGVSHYVQKKAPTQRCSAVRQAPPPPTRPYLPLASALESRPLAPAPSTTEKPPLPLMNSPLAPPLGLPPLPGEEVPPPLVPTAPTKN